MIAGLQGLRGKVQGTSGVARIHPRADLKDVVTLSVRFAEALQCVTKGDPRSPSRLDTSPLQSLNARAILLKNGSAASF